MEELATISATKTRDGFVQLTVSTHRGTECVLAVPEELLQELLNQKRDAIPTILKHTSSQWTAHTSSTDTAQELAGFMTGSRAVTLLKFAEQNGG